MDAGLDRKGAAEWISAMISGVYLEAAINDGFNVTQQLGNLRRTVRAYLAGNDGG